MILPVSFGSKNLYLLSFDCFMMEPLLGMKRIIRCDYFLSLAVYSIFVFGSVPER